MSYFPVNFIIIFCIRNLTGSNMKITSKIFLLVYFQCFIILLQSKQLFSWYKPRKENIGLPNSIEIYKLRMKQSPFQTPLTGSFARFDFNDQNLDFKVVHTQHHNAKTPVQWAEIDNHQVYAVINGGFFFWQKMKSASFICEDGEVYEQNHPKGVNKNLKSNEYPTLGAIGQNKNRKFQIGWIYSFGQKLKTYLYDAPNKYPGPQPRKENGRQWDIQEGIGAGPILLKNGVILRQNNENFDLEKLVYKRHPRSGICYDQKGRLLLVSIDGRYQESAGVNLQQFSVLLRDLGCVDALNLDGGGSSLLYANNQILTRYSDTVPRKVISAIVIRDKNKRKSRHFIRQETD